VADNFITVISKVANPSTVADVAYIVRLVGGQVQFQACSSFVQGAAYYLVRQRCAQAAIDDGFGENGGQIKRLVTGLIGGIISENLTIPSMAAIAFGESALIKAALGVDGVHALYSQVVTEFGYDLKTLSQLTTKFGGISMATVMLTGIVALGDARYHHRAVVLILSLTSSVLT